MFIGPANDEIKKMGGSNVVVLEDDEIEKIGEAMFYGESGPIVKIINWARKEGKGKPFIDNGKTIFIQTGESKNLQYSLPVKCLKEALNDII